MDLPVHANLSQRYELGKRIVALLKSAVRELDANPKTILRPEVGEIIRLYTRCGIGSGPMGSVFHWPGGSMENTPIVLIECFEAIASEQAKMAAEKAEATAPDHRVGPPPLPPGSRRLL